MGRLNPCQILNFDIIIVLNLFTNLAHRRRNLLKYTRRIQFNQIFHGQRSDWTIFVILLIPEIINPQITYRYSCHLGRYQFHCPSLVPN